MDIDFGKVDEFFTKTCKKNVFKPKIANFSFTYYSQFLNYVKSDFSEFSQHQYFPTLSHDL